MSIWTQKGSSESFSNFYIDKSCSQAAKINHLEVEVFKKLLHYTPMK